MIGLENCNTTKKDSKSNSEEPSSSETICKSKLEYTKIDATREATGYKIQVLSIKNLNRSQILKSIGFLEISANIPKSSQIMLIFQLY